MGKVVLKRICVTLQKQIGCFRYSSLQSYFHAIGEEPLKNLTLGQLAELANIKYNDRAAVISCHQNKTLTYGELIDYADRLAAGFRKLNLHRGDRIGIWAPNLVEWYVSFIACARAGYVSVALNPYYQSTEIEYVIKKVRLKALICKDNFRRQNYYDILNQVCPEISKSKPGHIFAQSIPSLRHLIVITDESYKGVTNYNDVLNLAEPEAVNKIKDSQHEINFDDPCNIQFTSGTTGSPKAPVQSHFSLVNNGYFGGKRIELHKKHHKVCIQNTLFHVYGTVIGLTGSLSHGATLVLPSEGYNPQKNLEAIAKEKCTVIYGTPTMYVDLVSLQREKQEQINPEIILSGGSIFPHKLYRDVFNVLKPKKIKSLYGLTETTCASLMSAENDTENQAMTTVGKVMDHLEVKIINENGNIVPFGKPGELCVRGYSIMLGYYEDEKKTKEVNDLKGWHHTGDQFVLTEDGYGSVVGRIKDMIIRGGENIYPKEVEEFLLKHPDILEVQVIGLPHERLGEQVCACIKTIYNRQISVQEIFEFCSKKISSFKIPSIVKVMETFPTTPSGKIQKFKLIEIVKNSINCK